MSRAATDTYAYGINDAGQIVGEFQDARGIHGFLRTSSGTFTTIDVPGATLTNADGINATGRIVGLFKGAGPGQHAFIRTSGGTFTTIDVPGARETHANGINAAGQIVGDFWDARGKIRGYVATPTP